jgi:ankyrin repeat protein
VDRYALLLASTLALGLAQAPPPDAANGRLAAAARVGDLAEVRAAIAAGANVNQESEMRMTPLGVAALYGQAPVVSALIAAGASVDADQDGSTAMMLAANEGHTAVLDALMTGGAKAAAADKNGMTPLMAAASANRTAAVKLLLARGAPVNAANRDGSTALMAAAFGGHVETVQALIAAGADVNVTDSQGRTPMMAAAMAGSLPAVRALIAGKANLQAEDTGGSTALIYAASNGQLEMVDALQAAGLTKGLDLAFSFAVRGCHMDLARKLAASGVKTNVVLNGEPVLLLAVASNCTEAVDYLIARGADVNAVDDEGTTPLMEAAADGFIPIIKTLLDHGANLDAMNKNRENAWLLAAGHNQRDVIEVFKEYREKKGPPK